MADTIAAVATPLGYGGIGVVRVSGPAVSDVIQYVLTKTMTPRLATFSSFHATNGRVLDQGLAIYFNGPHSFTGEDVLELQGHGGPVVLDSVLKAVLSVSGVRLANPGEFSERAFLNGKMDLVQAEAIADLIHATTEHAAASALLSMQGEFSKKIYALIEALIRCRMFVEAAIDFPDEDIDFISDHKILETTDDLCCQLTAILREAKQGVILREGLRVVIAGKPNVGKSSLLNVLTGKPSAIVTAIPGTTRDVLREHIHIDGLPLHVMDTAGLRESHDVVEQEGIARAWHEINEADVVLVLIDATDVSSFDINAVLPCADEKLLHRDRVMFVVNKIDLVKPDQTAAIFISAKTGEGIDALKVALKQAVGLQATTEGVFLARRRHLEAISQALAAVLHGKEQLQAGALEFFAEDCRVAQQALSTITGEFTSDDLLGKIFSEFCIGK